MVGLACGTQGGGQTLRATARVLLSVCLTVTVSRSSCRSQTKRRPSPIAHVTPPLAPASGYPHITPVRPYEIGAVPPGPTTSRDGPLGAVARIHSGLDGRYASRTIWSISAPSCSISSI
jgi:hypothetical protein